MRHSGFLQHRAGSAGHWGAGRHQDAARPQQRHQRLQAARTARCAAVHAVVAPLVTPHTNLFDAHNGLLYVLVKPPSRKCKEAITAYFQGARPAQQRDIHVSQLSELSVHVSTP